MKSKDFFDVKYGIRRLEIQSASTLHLTVNENRMSKVAAEFLNSPLANRYYFGKGKDNIVDFGSYTFFGLPEVEELIEQGRSALLAMSGAKVANLNLFSGIHAMMCVILACTKPGDTILSIPFEKGGHGATKGIIENSGRKCVFAEFVVEKLDFDIKRTAEIYKASGAKAVYIDLSVHLNSLDLRALRKELGEEALIIYDASHCLGLVLGGVFESPLKCGADVICANTHKTFPGPQKGVILFKDEEFGREKGMLIDTTFVSSVHPGELMALATTLLEFEEYGALYATQVVNNSRQLALEFKKRGFELRISKAGTYSDNEQVHLFVDKVGERINLYKNLCKNRISTNFMQVLGGRTFARIGTQEITRRGMKEKDLAGVADLFIAALLGKNVADDVIEFNKKFPNIKYSFDCQDDS